MMTGRTRLSWVTALTVASLLLGGGTLNALADGRGGDNKGHGGGSGKVERQEQTVQRPAEVRHDDQSGKRDNDVDDDDRRGPNRGRDNDRDDDDDLVTPPARVTDDTRPGLGCGDRNHEHLGAPGNPDKECEDRHGDGEQHDGHDDDGPHENGHHESED
jgi:hypothetical protein